MSKNYLSGMKNFGDTIKKIRTEKKLPLRTVAIAVGIDQAILSKIERSQRKPTRAQVVQFAAYFKINENDLLVAWLTDKLVYEVQDEKLGLKALQLAEQRVSYITTAKTTKKNMINSIRIVLKNDARVAAAWLFGSIARGEEQLNSDVDIMVEMNTAKKYSMFDLLDIAFIIEKTIMRKVDVVEKGYLKDFAMKTAAKDLIQIYG